MSGPRFAPAISRGILRAASVVLLLQGLFAWAMLLGIAMPGADLSSLPGATRNLLVTNAVLCPVAAIGAWFVSEWGPVLWFCAAVSLGIGLAVSVPLGPALLAAFALHLLLLPAWLVTAMRLERRADRSRPEAID